MSSETPNPQQLYESEKHRAKSLEKKNVRLEAEMGQVKQRLEAEVVQVKQRLEAEVVQVKQRLDDLEATLELKDERIRDQDYTIQNLQSAFDNADRPSGSGDDNMTKELQAKIHRLEEELSKVKTELSVANSDVTWLRNYITELRKDLDELEAVARNHLRSENEVRRRLVELMASTMTQIEGSRAKLDDRLTLGKRMLDAFEKRPRPVAQSVQLPAPAPAKAVTRLHDQGSESRSALHTSKEALTQSKPVSNPSVTSALKPINSMAQMAVDPPKPKVHPAQAFFEIDPDEPRARSKVFDMEMIRGTVVENVIKCGVSKSRPALQTATRRGSGDSTPIEFAHLESWEEMDRKRTPVAQAEKVVEGSRSPAELEMLRLKDRQTLHTLGRF